MLIDYSCPIWFNDLINGMASTLGKIPVSIVAIPLEMLKKSKPLPAMLNREIKGFSNLIAIYLKPDSIMQDRFYTYRNDYRFLKMPETDCAGKIIRKLKLIALPGVFNSSIEQELSLTLGIVNRLQNNEGYQIKSIDERFYGNSNVALSLYNGKKLVHLLAIKTR